MNFKKLLSIIEKQKKSAIFFAKIIAAFLFLFNLQAYSQTEFEPFWGRIPSPLNQDVRVLSVDSNNVLYAGVWGDGVYKSENDGDNWTKVNNGLSNLFVTSIEINREGDVYVGTFGGGVFRSTNKGAQWTPMNDGLIDLNIKTLCIYENGDMLAGSYGGGVTKYDSLKTWRRINDKMTFLDINCIVLAVDSFIVVGTNGGGIFRSSNEGKYWMRVNSGLKSYTINDMVVGSNGEIYAATLGGGVHVSYQNGTGWQTYFDKSNHPLYANCIAEWAYEEPIVGTISRGVVKFDINYAGIPGNTPWRDTERTYFGVNDIVVTPSGKVFTAQPYNGILRSDDGGYEYTEESLGFQLTGVFDQTGITPLWAGDNGLLLASTFQGGVARSTNKGADWATVALSGTQVFSYAEDRQGNFYAATLDGAFKSTDRGVTWNNLGWTDTIYSIAVNNAGHIFIGDSAIRKSTDNGATWQIKGIYQDQYQIKFIKISANGYIYCNMFKQAPDAVPPPPPYPNGLQRSTDNGETWDDIIPDTIASIENLVIDENRIYAGATDGLYISTNLGTDWTKETLNFPENRTPWITSLLVTSSKHLMVYEGITQIVMRSTDNGVSWDSLRGGFVKGNVESIAANSDGDIFLSTTCVYRAIENEDLVVPTLISPTGDIGGVEVKPKLKWNGVHNAPLYEFQISEDPYFEDILEYAVHSGTEWNLVRPLDKNTKHFWRVRSKRNKSVSEWSETGAFFTIIESPEMINPPDSSFGIDTNITFLWHSVEDCNGYQIQVSKDEYFYDLLVMEDELIDTSFTYPGLELDTVYYWRVKANSSRGNSDWSEPWVFNTKLPAPDIIRPNHQDYVAYDSVVFKWKKHWKADRYNIVIAKDSLFDEIIYDSLAYTDSSHYITTLDYGMTYYWKLQAESDSALSYWSETRIFYTNLEAAILVYPENNSANVPLPIEFQWDAPKIATSFHFQLADNPEFTNPMRDDTLEERSVEIEELDFKQYYWRVRYFADSLTGVWSDAWNFTPNPGSAVMTYPEEDMKNVPLDAKLTWEAPKIADKFHLQIARDEAFEDIVVERLNLKVMEFNIKTISLDPVSTYYWRVRIEVDGIPGLWADPWAFSTGIWDVDLVSPADKSDKQPLEIDFDWDPVEGAESYDIQIATDEDFANITEEKLNLTDTELSTVLPDSGQTYYWRARGVHADGDGPWSDVWELKTDGASGVDDISSLIFDIGAYPNPFADYVNISYTLAAPERISLYAVDNTGAIVGRLYEGLRPAGANNIRWRPNSLPSGVYTIVINISGRIASHRVVFVR